MDHTSIPSGLERLVQLEFRTEVVEARRRDMGMEPVLRSGRGKPQVPHRKPDTADRD